MPDTMIELRNLTKVYQRGSQQVCPLLDISFSIERGEFLALVGPSGSGKTTLLNIVAGIDRPTSGWVFFEGRDLAALREVELARWRQRHVGYVFQSYNLIPVLTARENVELPLLLRRLTGRRRSEQAQTALELVGLADRAGHFPGQLSGGQEQRVAIARAIASDPTVIVADEPTGDLDAGAAEDVLGLLRQLNQDMGKTIVMVSHDPRAVRYAGLIRRLDKGVLSEASGVPA